jgi:NADP-reducing hydrogenase subunit HndB
MPKYTKGDCAKLRKGYRRFSGSEIMISMGTCGIAAGAETLFHVFEEALRENGIANVKLSKTGCLGMCFCEPNIAVRVDGMPDIFYGNVDAKMAQMIVTEHIVRKNIVGGEVIFMPTIDMGKRIFSGGSR